jgi:hypothetical protein
MSKSKFETMSIWFFDVTRIVHFEFVPERATVNETFCVEVLRRLIDAVRSKRGELWRGRSLILHHDNAPVCSSRRVSQFLSRKRRLCHGSSAVLSWLGSCWLLAVSRPQELLKGKRFSDVGKKKSDTFLLRILKTVLMAKALGKF